ncbi:ribonuclease HII [bacterium (candidate division B38) B3_B38]|nr:MAG: ribonuclease HII [bacterium (candidate division B38) B3_B38]
MLSLEEEAIKRGYQLVAGLDEAGRGSLCGSVVAAAVVLDLTGDLQGIKDSKCLSARKREHLYYRIVENAVCWAVGLVEAEEIDRINIKNATFKAMKEAVNRLEKKPNLLLVDGLPLPSLGEIPQVFIVKGDANCLSIAAASIVAKVTRDRIMVELDKEYPEYRLRKNKGYGTAEHLRALKLLGPSPIHRLTFNPMKSTIGTLF